MLLFGGISIQAQSLTSGEYFFNSDPGVGNGISFSYSPSDSVHQTINVPISSLAPGFHYLFLRVKNNIGVWSHSEGRMFYIIQPTVSPTIQPELVSGEYFFNADPGIGNGTPFSFSQSDSVHSIFNVNVSSLSPGFHHLYIRVKNNAGIWSHHEGRMFYVIQPSALNSPQPNLISGEWFVDTDPGIGNATAFSYTTSDSVNLVINPTIGNLTSGWHRLYIRVKNTNGKWSHYEGRQFYVCNDILAPSALIGNTSFCQGETITITGSPVPNATNYLWQGPNGFTQSGLTLMRTNASALMNGEYKLRAVRTGGTFCDTSYASIMIQVNPTFSSTNSVTICAGESVSVGSNTYSNSGTYTDILPSIQGCDSTIITQLTVLPEITNSNPQTVCFGESYSINGNTYATSGTYTDVFQSITGCDSTVTTILTVNPTFSTNNLQTICQGESITIGSNTYSSAGTYTDVLQSINGCDSTVTTVLTVNQIFTSNNPQTICQGESVTVGTNTYSVAGTYTDVLQSIQGCDSTITTVLTVNPIFISNNPQTVCFGESYSLNGNTYSTSGSYIDVLQSISGCDSTVTTILTVLPAIATNNPQTVCFGESYSINGNTYSASGTYTDVLQSVQGCDSTVTTQLTVLPVLTGNNPQTICQGESVTVGSSIYTTAGTYTDVLQSVNGCDSTVTTVVTITTPTLNTQVTINEVTLSATENAATYQWIDCDNGNAPISGATSQSFTATQNGNYAVILTSTVCTDISETSACQNINSVGLEEIISFTLNIHPNPTENELFISSNEIIDLIQIKDLSGKRIDQISVGQTETKLNLENLSQGVYLIEVETKRGVRTERIIKN